MSTEKLVAFIDLLGTKDSHKVSTNELASHLTLFAQALAENASRLDENTSSIDHFSDCAYIATSSIDSRVFDFLADVRFSLLRHGLYFKCGVDLVKSDETQINDKVIYENVGKASIPKVETFFKYRLFGREIIPAYLHHEGLKGVGFSVSSKAADAGKGKTVESLFVNEKVAGAFIKFKDIRFSGQINSVVIDLLPSAADEENNRERIPDARDTYYDAYVASVKKRKCASVNDVGVVLHFAGSKKSVGTELELLDHIIHSTKRAHFRDSSYIKYYLSMFVTLIRSSPFDLIWYDHKCKSWRGEPIVFSKLVTDGAYRSAMKNYKNFEVLPLCLLSMILSSIDRRRALLCHQITAEELEPYIKTDLLPRGFNASELNELTGPLPTMPFSIDLPMHLEVLQTTEVEAVKRLFGLHVKTLAGRINAIPDFILHPNHKRRVETVLAGSHL